MFRALPLLAVLQADGILERSGHQVRRRARRSAPGEDSSPRLSTLTSTRRPGLLAAPSSDVLAGRVFPFRNLSRLLRELSIDRGQGRRKASHVADDGVAAVPEQGREVALGGGIDRDAEHGGAHPARFLYGLAGILDREAPPS